MQLTDLLEILRQLAFISAVLAGFSVTLFIGVMQMDPERRRIVLWAAGMSLVGATLLIVSTVAGVGGIVASAIGSGAGPQAGVQVPVFGAFQWSVWSFLLGTFAFLVSLGLSGRAHSRTLGWVSAIVSGVTILGVLYFLLFVVDAF